MRHNESKLQQGCVRWFRYQYPHMAHLLFHPKNEGHGDRIAGAIAKAEGVVAGVPDLMLVIPNAEHHLLCLEMKTAKGRQSESQKLFQRHIEAAGGQYVIVRDLYTFVEVVSAYVSRIPDTVINGLIKLSHEGEETK